MLKRTGFTLVWLLCNAVAFSQHFTQSLTLSILSDYVKSPVVEGQGVIGFNGRTGEPIYKTSYFQSTSLNVFSFGYQPTLELSPAVILTAPITLGIGLTQPTDDDLNYTNGLSSLKIPVFFALRSNQSDQISFVEVGVGYQLSVFPILNLDDGFSSDQLNFVPMGYIRTLLDNKRPLEVGFKMGLGPLVSYSTSTDGKPLIDSNGNRIEKTGRAVNAQLWLGFPFLNQ